jgi:type IV secretory pathway TraG/TraD family ATPase VirD4
MLLNAPVAIAAAIFFIFFFRWLAVKPKVSHVHLRGRKLRGAKEIGSVLLHARTKQDPGIRVGDRIFPSRLACGHFAVVGATGSGKTLIQRLLLQSALPMIGQGLGHRALIYDAKQDLLSLLAGMKLRCPVSLLHPLDLRSAAWDMAQDITAPSSALQAATILIPETKGDANPFFTNAARHLLYGTLLGCIARTPNRWTLRQVLLIVRDKERLKQALSAVPQTEVLLQYFEHPTTFQNILSTILTCTAPYEILAATWDKAEKKISLREWLQNESILVLGNDERNRAAIDTMNRLIFRRVSELILSGPELSPADQTRTWLFLDEAREAGRLEGLSRLLTQGRSKGAAVVLGFQDIAGLRDVYGANLADELIGQCNSKVFLRLNSPGTAEWASKIIGGEEVLESRAGSSRHRESARPLAGSEGNSVSHGIAQRPLVLPSELMALPETSPENGLTGFVVTPLTGPYRMQLSGEWLAEQLRPPQTSFPNLVPRPEGDQYLRPWMKGDSAEQEDPLGEAAWLRTFASGAPAK